MISGGKPFGYVGNGRSRTIPAISKWPVMVSFPAEASIIFPCAVPGAGSGGTPATSVRHPSPSAARFGASRPRTAAATCPTVFAPASP